MGTYGGERARGGWEGSQHFVSQAWCLQVQVCLFSLVSRWGVYGAVVSGPGPLAGHSTPLALVWLAVSLQGEPCSWHPHPRSRVPRFPHPALVVSLLLAVSWDPWTLVHPTQKHRTCFTRSPGSRHKCPLGTGPSSRSCSAGFEGAPTVFLALPAVGSGDSGEPLWGGPGLCRFPR